MRASEAAGPAAALAGDPDEGLLSYLEQEGGEDERNEDEQQEGKAQPMELSQTDHLNKALLQSYKVRPVVHPPLVTWPHVLSLQPRVLSLQPHVLSLQPHVLSLQPRVPGQASVDRMVAGDQQWRPGMPPPPKGGVAGGGALGPSAAARGPSARLGGRQPDAGPGSPGQVREVGGLVREHVEFV